MIPERSKTDYAVYMKRTDLTTGPIASSLMFFALPLIFGNMLQTLYNAADSIIVGRFIGPDALASVGSAYSLMTFLTSIMIGLAMGSGISFSYLYAGNELKMLRRALALSFALAHLGLHGQRVSAVL